MRRWNGWGDDAVVDVLPAGAAEFLDPLVGPETPPVDAMFVALRTGRIGGFPDGVARPTTLEAPVGTLDLPPYPASAAS